MAPQSGSRYTAQKRDQDRLGHDDGVEAANEDGDKDVNHDDGEIVVEFVIPTGKTEITVSDDLHRAHAMCVAASVACRWTKEMDVSRSIPRDHQVFVMDPFSGPGFTHVTENSRQCTVLGPRVLITCIETSSPVPQVGYPVLNCAMMGLIVTSSGLAAAARERAERLVMMMGGQYSSHFHEGITHLVAAATTTRKYEVAVEREVAVMTEAWVEAVWTAGTKENVLATHPRFAAYRCPALQGVTVSVSQLTKEDRAILNESVCSHGGQYSGGLERDVTTVLVCAKAEGEKYLAASRWNIPCLTAAWVYNSIEKGHSLPYDGYRVEECGLDATQSIPNWYGIYLPDDERSDSLPTTSDSRAASDSRATSDSRVASDSMAGMAELSIQDRSESTYDSTLTLDSTKSYLSANSSASATINSSSNATNSIATKSTANILNVSKNATVNSSSFATTMSCNSTPPTFILDKSAAASNAARKVGQALINSEAKAEENQKKTVGLLDTLDISSVKRAGTFLDGCKVFLSGLSERQIGQMRRVLKFAGATWLSALAESVTHVVHCAACHVDPATAKAIQELDISPHSVSLDWVVASMKGGKPAVEAEHMFPPSSEEGNKGPSCQEIKIPSFQDEQGEDVSSQFEDSLLAQYGSINMRVM